MNKNGFTLLELAIVLTIIAVLTHLAVREASTFANMNRRAEANKQLETIRDALFGPGEDFESGFFADMGRLPRAVAFTNENGTVSYTLAELWLKPSNASTFRVLQAIPGNIADGDTANADAEVQVPCGWRGPYIRLPLGKDRFRDPWGNPYESPDSAGGKQRLRTGGDAGIDSEGESIAIVRHLGADGVPDAMNAPASAEAQDCAFTNRADTATSLIVMVVPVDSNGAVQTALPTSVCVYGPHEDDSGMKLYVRAGSGTPSATVLDLKPGVHMMKVRYNAQNIWPSQRIVLKPGINYATVTLSVPDGASTGGTGG